MNAMDCHGAQELFSAHREGTLDPVLQDGMEAHLRACAACRDLREAFDDVVSALGAFPLMEPSADLAERSAALALASARVARAPAARSWQLPIRLWAFRSRDRAALVPPRRGMSLRAFRIEALAAGLALLTTGVLLWSRQAGLGPSLDADRLVERTVNARVYLAERKDRLVEDLRILRIVIGTAFEERLDSVNDRVDDYRRLLEERRATEEDAKRSRGEPGSSSQLRSADGPVHSLNLGGDRRVEAGVGRAAAGTQWSGPPGTAL
jgi:hypothetical protein